MDYTSPPKHTAIGRLQQKMISSGSIGQYQSMETSGFHVELAAPLRWGVFICGVFNMSNLKSICIGDYGWI